MSLGSPRISAFEATILTIPDHLLVHIFSYLDPRDIITCSLLSNVIFNVIRHYKTLVWDIDTFFQPWFRDSAATFRVLLKKCGAVVSGSQIMQFLDRTRYPESDIDIFLRVGGLVDMGVWLIEQGYKYISSTPNVYRVVWDAHQLSAKMITGQDSPAGAIKGVFNYSRYIASDTVIHVQKIQLIVVDINPINHILFDFHSTVVMNYMLSDAIVSIFPVSSFLLRKSYVCRSKLESPDRAEQWKSKYKDRGYRIIRRRSRGDHKDIQLGKRSTHDRHCWTIKLPVYGNIEQDVRFDVFNWRSNVTVADSFLRIAESGVWK
ncbi:hypothetical protein C8R43DRAFT_956117 [Mycena crocata]|nr:hypothetical protein C8R43DRAFT_956117 [Mycena crocata]